MKELFQETNDPLYQRLHVLFRPWDQARGEIIMLTGHLAEDLKGELKFIERAVGVGNAKALYESESGEVIGIRELSRRLTKDGYPISPSHISRMLDTVQHLLPAVPALLYNGLGKPQIEKILSLRKSALACWDKHYSNEGVDFEMLFQDVLAQFEGEAEEFLFQRFQDELIGTMKKSLLLGYEDILLEITQQQDKLRRSTPVVELPITSSTSTPPAPAPGTGQALPFRHRNNHLKVLVARSGLRIHHPSQQPQRREPCSHQRSSRSELQGTLRPQRISASE